MHPFAEPPGEAACQALNREFLPRVGGSALPDPTLRSESVRSPLGQGVYTPTGGIRLSCSRLMVWDRIRPSSAVLKLPSYLLTSLPSFEDYSIPLF
jgi:hypothetical protein